VVLTNELYTCTRAQKTCLDEVWGSRAPTTAGFHCCCCCLCCCYYPTSYRSEER